MIDYDTMKYEARSYGLFLIIPIYDGCVHFVFCYEESCPESPIKVGPGESAFITELEGEALAFLAGARACSDSSHRASNKGSKMQETFRDGTEVLRQIESSRLAQEVQESVDDPEVVKTTIHKEGSIITLRSGRQYQVQTDGSFRRYPPKNNN